MVDQLQTNIKFNLLLCQRPNIIQYTFRVYERRYANNMVFEAATSISFSFLASFFFELYSLNRNYNKRNYKKFGFQFLIYSCTCLEKSFYHTAQDAPPHTVLFLLSFAKIIYVKIQNLTSTSSNYELNAQAFHFYAFK